MTDSTPHIPDAAIPLQPMHVSELFRTTLRLYRRHFWYWVALVAVVQIPLSLLELSYETMIGPAGRLQAVSQDVRLVWQVYPTPNQYYTDMWQLLIVRFLLLLLTLFAVQGLMAGAVAKTLQSNCLGRPGCLAKAYRGPAWRWFSLVEATFVLGVLNVGFFLLFFIPCVGWLAAPLLMIYVNVPVFSLVAPVIVLEGHGCFSGLARAFNLGRHNFWRVLAVNVVLWVAMGLLAESLMLLFRLGFSLWEPPFALGTVIRSLVSLSIALFARPIWACVLALLYFDLRARVQNSGVELRAHESVA